MIGFTAFLWASLLTLLQIRCESYAPSHASIARNAFRKRNAAGLINSEQFCTAVDVDTAIDSTDTKFLSPVRSDESGEDNIDLDFEHGSTVTWTAAVSSSTRVKELKRTTEQYMALPASDYSILAAEQVIRESDTDFKIVLGTINFFGSKFTPVLYVTVNVIPEEAKSEIIVTRAETIGSAVAENINGTFSISAVNTVTAGRDKRNRKVLSSDTKLKIDALVPKSKIPAGIIKTGGSFVLQSSLNIIVPTFIRILAADFKRWSAGDDSRDAVDGASLDLQ